MHGPAHEAKRVDGEMGVHIETGEAVFAYETTKLEHLIIQFSFHIRLCDNGGAIASGLEYAFSEDEDRLTRGMKRPSGPSLEAH